LRRIGWPGVMAGVAVTIPLVLGLAILVGSVIDPYLYDLFAVEKPGGVTSFTGKAWNNYMMLSGAFYLAVLPVAVFVGGLVVGMMVRSAPGLNGVVSALVVMLVVLAWFLATVLPTVLDLIGDPRSEDLGNLFVMVMAICVDFPLVVLAGYVGERLGGYSLPSGRGARRRRARPGGPGTQA
jgi:hypothetical protein